VPRVIGGTVQAHREHVTAKIFDAVHRLLYERGYDGITLADVAEASGMSRTSMYNYFGDKASLVLAYATHETARFTERLDEELRRLSNPVDQLRAYVRLQLEYFDSHHLPPGPALRLLLPEDEAPNVMAHVRELESRLEGIVLAGRDRRYLEVDDLDATVAMILACISRGAESAEPLARRVELTEAFVLRALGARLDADGTARKLPRR